MPDIYIQHHTCPISTLMDKIKKHLVVFHPTVAPYRIDLFNRLSEMYDTDIYLLMNKFNVFMDYQKIVDKMSFVPQYVFPDTAKDKTRSFSRRFWKIIDRKHPDTVLSFEFSACTIMVLLHRFLSGGKYRVVTLCDDSPDMIRNSSLRHRIFRNLCCKYINEVILCSPEVRDWYKMRFNKGVYFPIIRNEKKALISIKNAWPMTGKIIEQYKLAGKRVYLFVGRIAPEKNIEYLLRSFRKVALDNEALIIVGDGPELAKLKRRYVDTAIFVGRKEDQELLAFYNIADVFILPSKIERFGAVTNEALLAGCFSLISTYCGSKCLINEGTNGYVFNPDDKEALSQSIIKSRQHTFEKKCSLMNCTFEEFFENIALSL